MSEKLRYLREHMDETVLKDVDFSESSKEKVRKALRAQSEPSSRKPWIYQLKNGLSVAACLMLLFCELIYAIHGQSPNGISGNAITHGPIKSASKANKVKYGSATSQSHSHLNKKVSEDTYLVRVMNGNTGWKLTKHNVWTTSDGGKSWSSVYPVSGNRQFGESAFFLNQNDAWVTVLNSDGSSTQFHTTNGGNSWSASKTQPPAGGMFDFVSPTDGWILQKHDQGNGNDAVTIYRTKNSGQIWKKVAETNQLGKLPSSGKVTGIGFERNSNGNGWLSGYEPKTNGYPWLYETKDGGITWQADSFPIKSAWKKDLIKTFPPMFFGDGALLPVTMTNKATGELNGIVFYSRQKNGNWSIKSKRQLKIQSSQVIYDFLDSKTGWVITDHGVYKTNDAGADWTPVNANQVLSNAMANGKAVELDINPDGNRATLLMKMNDGSSKLLTTKDGGHNWN